jgi:hypothetical protein
MSAWSGPASGRSAIWLVRCLWILAAVVGLANCASPMPCEGIDLQTDVSNCGACGNRCSFDHGSGVCVRGRCEVTTCEPGFADLDPRIPGCEENLSTSPVNCGTVGHACNYRENGGELCVDGTCVCARADQTHCGNRCTVLEVDQDNCGACGHRCTSGEACFDGVCRAASCPADSVLVPGGVLVLSVFAPGESIRIAPFCLSRTEQTVSQFAECVRARACASRFPDQLRTQLERGSNDPIEIGNFLESLDLQRLCTHLGGRLPTAAEWHWEVLGRSEYRPYPWGSEPPSCEHGNWTWQDCQCRGAWNPWCCNANPTLDIPCSERGLVYRSAVGQVGAHHRGVSRDGAEDMAGNVSELVTQCAIVDSTIGRTTTVRCHPPDNYPTRWIGHDAATWPVGGDRRAVAGYNGVVPNYTMYTGLLTTYSHDPFFNAGTHHEGVRCAFDPM